MKTLKETPGGRRTFLSPATHYKRLQRNVVVDTFNHEEGFEKVFSNCRAKVVKHVGEKVEDHYWLYDGLYEDCTKWFVIEHDGDTDSGSDDTECSGSDDGSGAEDDRDESSMDD